MHTVLSALRLLPPFVCACFAVVVPPRAASGQAGHMQAPFGEIHPRPLIVLIHGRAQEFKPAESLRRDWIAALSDGFAKVGAPRPDSADVVLVLYRDLFEPGRPSRVNGCIGVLPQRLSDGEGSSLSMDGELGSGPLRKSVMATFEDSEYAHRLIVGRLPDTDEWLSDPAVRCAVNQRLHDALASADSAGRPVIVVGHSMGTLVAFATLQERRSLGALPLRRFVALGSQLPSAYLRKKIARMTYGAGATLDASHAESMVLARGRFDYVGLRRHDADGRQLLRAKAKPNLVFTRDSTYVDLEIDTDANDPHSIESYLLHPLVALAIASPWCAGNDACATPPAVQACDYDIIARPRMAFAGGLRREDTDPDSLEARLRAWRFHGSKERQRTVLRPARGTADARWTTSISGRHQTLSPEELQLCEVEATDVRASLIRNPADSTRLAMANVGVALDRQLSFELGTSLTRILPRFIGDKLGFEAGDIRVQWRPRLDGWNDEAGVGLRASLGFGVYGMVGLGPQHDERSGFGVSLPGFFYSVFRYERAGRWFGGHPDRATNDLFIEYRQASALGPTKFDERLTMGLRLLLL